MGEGFADISILGVLPFQGLGDPCQDQRIDRWDWDGIVYFINRSRI